MLLDKQPSLYTARSSRFRCAATATSSTRTAALYYYPAGSIKLDVLQVHATHRRIEVYTSAASTLIIGNTRYETKSAAKMAFERRTVNTERHASSRNESQVTFRFEYAALSIGSEQYRQLVH